MTSLYFSYVNIIYKYPNSFYLKCNQYEEFWKHCLWPSSSNSKWNETLWTKLRLSCMRRASGPPSFLHLSHPPSVSQSWTPVSRAVHCISEHRIWIKRRQWATNGSFIVKSGCWEHIWNPTRKWAFSNEDNAGQFRGQIHDLGKEGKYNNHGYDFGFLTKILSCPKRLNGPSSVSCVDNHRSIWLCTRVSSPLYDSEGGPR